MCLTQDHMEQDQELAVDQLHGIPSANAVLNSDPAIIIILVNTKYKHHIILHSLSLFCDSENARE